MQGIKQESLFIKRLKERLKNSYSSGLLLSLASEFSKSGKIYQAISIIKTGVEKDPDYVPARFLLGRWYMDCDMLLDAKKEFIEVLQREPENIFAKELISEIDKRLGLNLSSKRDKVENINRLNRFLIILRKRFSS
jgi:tetratricopeptide (TPR) repeat protein